MRRIWRSSNTGTSRMSRIPSLSMKTWWWKILRKYWMWVRKTADHSDQIKKWSKTKVRVYSGSVLCLGRMISSREETKEKWSIQVGQFKMYSTVDEFYGTDGEAVEFGWKISQNNITDLMRDPEILTMSERWIRTILCQDHIHVNVQRTAKSQLK